MDDDRDITDWHNRNEGYRTAIKDLVKHLKKEGKTQEEAFSFCEWIFPYDPKSYVPRLTKEMLTRIIQEVYK